MIADATSFESARRETRKQKKATTTAENAFVGYVSSADIDPRMPLNLGSGDIDSEGDEEFVRTWRKNRMAELRTGIATQRRQSPSKRKYGKVEIVDAVGYLDAVEKVSPETVVVVTIYNDKVRSYPNRCIGLRCSHHDGVTTNSNMILILSP